MIKKHPASPFLLDLWACFIIPAYTLLFAGSIKWFSTNFSVLAVTGKDHWRGFLVWGVLAGGYFLVMLVSLTRSLKQKWLRRVLYTVTAGACICLGIALPLPYVPEYFPGIARLHIMMAFSACALLMGALLLAVVGLGREYRSFLRGWWAIVVCCAALFVLAGIISSALEVFFTISVTLFIRRLWLRVYRQNQ